MTRIDGHTPFWLVGPRSGYKLQVFGHRHLYQWCTCGYLLGKMNSWSCGVCIHLCLWRLEWEPRAGSRLADESLVHFICLDRYSQRQNRKKVKDLFEDDDECDAMCFDISLRASPTRARLTAKSQHITPVWVTPTLIHFRTFEFTFQHVIIYIYISVSAQSYLPITFFDIWPNTPLAILTTTCSLLFTPSSSQYNLTLPHPSICVPQGNPWSWLPSLRKDWPQSTGLSFHLEFLKEKECTRRGLLNRGELVLNKSREWLVLSATRIARTKGD